MTKKDNPNALHITCNEDENEDSIVASININPSVLAGSTIKGRYKKNDTLKLNNLVEELDKQIKQVQEGDLSRPEAMLVAQAHTLDALFAELISRSRMNMEQYLDASDRFMRLALKAQSQCRTTIEAIAEIKNPKPYIQNNRAEYQQVNNGATPAKENNLTSTRTHAHARENLKSANELLEDKTHEQQWMDGGTPQTSSRDDKDLETVGAFNRGED